MKKLIEALKILSKYTNSDYPINCEKGVMFVAVDPFEVKQKDKEKLLELGFYEVDEFNEKAFASKWYGSYSKFK